MTDTKNTRSPGDEAPAPGLTEMLALLVPDVRRFLQRAEADRKAAQTWSTVKRAGLAITFVLGLVMWLFGYGTVLGLRPSVITATVAEVEINGPIGNGHLASADRIVPLLTDLCSQPLVRGVVLHIDSPGGAPGDAERIGAAIDACKTQPAADGQRAEKGREVVAVIDGLGASAAYMIAVHADRIIANPTGMVGSIGIIIEGLKFDGLMSHVGVTGYAYASGPMKTMLSPYMADTDDQKRVASELAHQAMEAFRADVIRRRPGLHVDDQTLWSGRVWVAAEAKHLGLIDDVGLLEPTERRTFPGLPVQRFAPQRDVRDALSMTSVSNAVIRALADRAVTVR